MSNNPVPQRPRSPSERRPSPHRVRFSIQQDDEHEEPSTTPLDTTPTRSSIPNWNIPNYQARTDRRVSEAVPPNGNPNSSNPPTTTNGDDLEPIDEKPDNSKDSTEGDFVKLPGMQTTKPLTVRKRKSPWGAWNDTEDLSRAIPGESGGPLSGLLNYFGADQYNFDREMQEAREDEENAEPLGRERLESFLNEDAQVLAPEDPTLDDDNDDDDDDVKMNVRREIKYHTRRKDRTRFRIEYNVSSVLNRQKFLMKLARALMAFGAPSHRIESQLLAAARILEVDAEFIHVPGVIICTFGDQGADTSELHFVKCDGRLSLGNLHKLHILYRNVVHDEISAKDATDELDVLLDAPPTYNRFTQLALAFWISALICPLAFGGSMIDMWFAGLGATFLCLMQIGVASKSQLYANVFEVTVTILVSFVARGLNSVGDQLFCYTAISSASIVGILPGYLILSSSLELASKNIVCGSVKMVYALIYTLFLGFGLQIGSDFYLLLDHSARDDLVEMAKRTVDVITFPGVFISDNTTGYMDRLNEGKFMQGMWSYINPNPLKGEHVKNGCYRPRGLPWFRKPFPWWTQFIIVPLFSILSSCANLQPFFNWDMVVMVLISCAAYAANKAADRFIFNRSDIVSAIGAFVVGVLGNIYSRKMRGTAFTSMVTGVLFLVPSGLSQIGGITAEGSGIDIGGAMIAVTIGITVGLYMSQAIVYMFGSRKNAALFSF